MIPGSYAGVWLVTSPSLPSGLGLVGWEDRDSLYRWDGGLLVQMTYPELFDTMLRNR